MPSRVRKRHSRSKSGNKLILMLHRLPLRLLAHFRHFKTRTMYLCLSLFTRYSYHLVCLAKITWLTGDAWMLAWVLARLRRVGQIILWCFMLCHFPALPVCNAHNPHYINLLNWKYYETSHSFSMQCIRIFSRYKFVAPATPETNSSLHIVKATRGHFLLWLRPNSCCWHCVSIWSSFYGLLKKTVSMRKEAASLAWTPAAAISARA